MTKTLLSGVAAIAFAFAAPTAFAQNSNVDTNVDAKTKTEQMIDAAEDATNEVEEAKDDLAGTADEMWDTEDDKMDKAEDSMDDDADVDAEVEGETYASPSVDCPTGTTVQADGTCMTVGEWDPKN